jgi:hypothetical protein
LSDVIDEDFCSWCALDDDDVMDTSVFDDGRPNAGRVGDDDDDDGCRLPLLLYLAVDVDGDMANGEKLNADAVDVDATAVDRTTMHAEE